ncbi:MAG: TetR/AcrR family transcriptional regulator [Erysipelotrichaceae bacterium]|nr:TetR/AcrR family transcriptional regulator [Erysipelotrichaceae bacterium]MDY6034039.1 TetR-like C-terminal domain-containing protein [Bulleidia sp.]
MNKSESKYFATAAKMDLAFLEILEKKDLEYITVKEICTKADVNRSTFYLHYETINDLLEESIEYIVKQFTDYMSNYINDDFFDKLNTRPIDELNLITPKYLHPYLTFLKEYRRLFITVMKRTRTLGVNSIYDSMYKHIFSPILGRHDMPEKDRVYMMRYYMQGIMAIINEWLKQDCKDSIEYITDIISRCVRAV